MASFFGPPGIFRLDSAGAARGVSLNAVGARGMIPGISPGISKTITKMVRFRYISDISNTFKVSIIYHQDQAKLGIFSCLHTTMTGTRTTIGRRNFAVSGPATWNRLPVELRTSSLSVDTFAKKLKSHLFNCEHL